MRNTLDDFFNWEKEKAEKNLSPKEIGDLFGRYMNYDVWHKLVVDFLGDQYSESNMSGIPFQNILLLSLIDSIPQGVDLSQPIDFSYKGLLLQMFSGQQKRIDFKPEIQEVILYSLFTLKLDSTSQREAMQGSMNLIKNLALFKDTDNGLSDMIHTDKYDKAPEVPLYDAFSQKDVYEYTKIDVRALLIDLVSWTNAFILKDCKYIAIVPMWIYTIDGDNICIIPFTDRLRKLFNFTDEYSIDSTKGSIRSIESTSVLQRYRDVIKEEISRVLEVASNESRSINVYSSTWHSRLIELLREKCNISVPLINIARFPELANHEYQDILMNALSWLEVVIWKVYSDTNMTISRHPHRMNRDLSNNKSVAVMLQNENKNFWREKSMNSFFSSSNIIYVEDVELLSRYPRYEKLFRSFVLARLFKVIINLSATDTRMREYYNGFREVIGEEILQRESRSLVNKKAFSRGSSILENTVLLNYFKHYATLYLFQKNWEELNESIPSEIKNFLRENIFNDVERLE